MWKFGPSATYNACGGYRLTRPHSLTHHPLPYIPGHSKNVDSSLGLLVQKGGKAPPVLPVSSAAGTVGAIGTVEFLRMIDMVWPITVPRPVLPFVISVR